MPGVLLYINKSLNSDWFRLYKSFQGITNKKEDRWVQESDTPPYSTLCRM